jgi:Ca-activated chloride channel family protein
MSRQKVLMMIATLFAWLWMPAGSAEELAPADIQSGTLLLKMQAGFTTATRTNTDVTMDVSGLVARVSVRQEFRNDGDEWTEGVYVFPLPDAAAVDRMKLHVGERFIEGEIREKGTGTERVRARPQRG